MHDIDFADVNHVEHSQRDVVLELADGTSGFLIMAEMAGLWGGVPGSPAYLFSTSPSNDFVKS